MLGSASPRWGSQLGPVERVADAVTRDVQGSIGLWAERIEAETSIVVWTGLSHVGHVNDDVPLGFRDRATSRAKRTSVSPISNWHRVLRARLDLDEPCLAVEPNSEVVPEPIVAWTSNEWRGVARHPTKSRYPGRADAS